MQHDLRRFVEKKRFGDGAFIPELFERIAKRLTQCRARRLVRNGSGKTHAQQAFVAASARCVEAQSRRPRHRRSRCGRTHPERMNPTYRRFFRPARGKRGSARKPVAKQCAILKRQRHQIGTPDMQDGTLLGMFGNERRNSFAKSTRPQKAADERFLVDDADTRSAKSARSHPEPPNKRSGERSIVYLADAARRTLRLQDGERAAGLNRPLDAKTRPFPKFDRDICTFGVDNPFSSMSNVDFAWRARAAETPFLLGANRHHDMLVQQLDETRIRFGRSVESASGS